VGFTDFHVVRIAVDGLTLNLQAIDGDGNPRDEITLTKPGYKFNRADANQDATHDIADAMEILPYLFADSYGNACLDAYDANDSEAVDIADAVYVLSYLFAAGPPPPPPFVQGPYQPEDCGSDPAGDQLGCEKFVPAEVPGDWESGWDL
jgi:hypothetical protein